MSITATLSGGIQKQNQNLDSDYQTFENERLKLQVDPEPFEATVKARTTTTKRLGMEVNRILKPVLNDYTGCTIYVNNFGTLSMDLFFTDMGEAPKDTIKSVCDIATYQANLDRSKNKETAAVVERISAFNNRLNKQKNTINESTREVLTDLLPFKMNKNQRNEFWKNNIIERSEANRMGGYSVYIQVTGLDISKLLKIKYGKKEDKSYLDYAIQLIRPIISNGNQGTNYLITISQLNNDQLKELCNEIGMIAPTGEIPMIRA